MEAGCDLNGFLTQHLRRLVVIDIHATAMKGERLNDGRPRRIVSLSLSMLLMAMSSGSASVVRSETDTVYCDTRLNPDTFLVSRKIYPVDKINIYDMPYSLTANYPDYHRLWVNTGVLFGGGMLALGVLQVLPEDATSWNKKEITEVPLFERWWRNVHRGPVIDKDDYIFNYVLHPYAGAAYYMGARSLGFNALYSFLYSAGISTFFWEYGIEAFMEIPSLQDLIITPVVGSLIGEGFYVLKRHIVANGYELFGSRLLGNVVAYIVDPVNEVIGLFAGNPCRNGNRSDNVRMACTPAVTASSGGLSLGFSLCCCF